MSSSDIALPSRACSVFAEKWVLLYRADHFQPCSHHHRCITSSNSRQGNVQSVCFVCGYLSFVFHVHNQPSQRTLCAKA